MRVELHSASAEETMEIARTLGASLRAGDVVALYGELGAGKTVFCKGIGEALGIAPERIVSPSFTIVTEHSGTLTLYHMDAYRLSGEREAEEIGLDEILYGSGVCVVEWAENIASLLPNRCIHVKFFISDESGRTLAVTAEDPRIPRELAARR
ncbi:MAG: tRNA (adenosine(37)-N6)-threonylcarbamoyltransferase complex ATPase subunit type 1 TsaE [Deltaproteobacteria bacterium]|nr:tRNA (adenosine(37)-N6)-threonylcarbamoyltransferase complex ATPase subunit type 1 TsaE [Deltaproteobacteria bacterium]